MIGVILAAGKGSRLNESLNSRSIKPLVRVGSVRLIEYSLNNLVDAHIGTAVIVVSEDNKKEILAVLGEKYKGISIKYAVQDNPSGLMHAIMSAAGFLNDDVVIQLSDEIFISPKVAECIKCFGKDSDFTVTYSVDPSAERIKMNFSVLTDEEGKVISCIEKPEKPATNMKGTGFCIFSKECIELMKKFYSPQDGYTDNLCDYMNLLIRNGKIGRAFNIAEEEININTVNDLDYAQNRVKR